MSSVSVGMPPVVSTVTASSKLTVAVTTSPALRRPFCRPVAADRATANTTGALVSTVTTCAVLAGLALPARSVNTALSW